MSTESNMPSSPSLSFRDLKLSEAMLKALDDVGYESPSPIQAATIPYLLGGQDVIGQAQTGTGKTAAFALPILSRLDLTRSAPQALVLTPTRELAIQVAEAFQRYATHLKGFHVLPIYGGQAYGAQLHGLKRGVHVVVGTPGRIIDHLQRGSLNLGELTYLVLDEADEMLRMGFIDDVETILKKTPAKRQVALFSATMPPRIRKIAQTYLNEPQEVHIQGRTSTANNIRQRYWLVSGLHKLDALTRILEVESFEAMIVFTRTKQGTEELAERLEARGFSAAAINGDVQQAQRERTITRLKDGQLDILVATDVAARGLDVERISHVLNYDIPHDAESYVHRIGRTGRAGRSGEAILFVTPRERHLLRTIERMTKQPIEMMELPSVEAVNDQRVNKFKQKITDTLATGGLDIFQSVIEQYEREHNVPALEVAAALAYLVQGSSPLLLDASSKNTRPEHEGDRAKPSRFKDDRRESIPRPKHREKTSDAKPQERTRTPASFDEKSTKRPPRDHARDDARPPKPEQGMETFRIEIGHAHGAKPNNIVGAIANEAGLDSKHIGRIDIRDDHSLIDLPEGMPSELLQHLKKVWVAGQQLRMTRIKEDHKPHQKPKHSSSVKKPFKPDHADKSKPRKSF